MTWKSEQPSRISWNWKIWKGYLSNSNAEYNGLLSIIKRVLLREYRWRKAKASGKPVFLFHHFGHEKKQIKTRSPFIPIRLAKMKNDSFQWWGGEWGDRLSTLLCALCMWRRVGAGRILGMSQTFLGRGLIISKCKVPCSPTQRLLLPSLSLCNERCLSQHCL